MKKVQLITAIICLLILAASCKDSSKDETATNAATENAKDEVTRQGETAIENAGKARKPKGTIAFKINGETFNANENTVQCMFIGMGSKDYAQGMVSGNGTNFSFSGLMMGKPGIGKFIGKKLTDPTGFQITIDGVQYNAGGGMGGEAIIEVTRVNQDGENLYIGGTFSGKLKSQDGKEITVTDGVFESAYL
jgi:hypothetical protein